MKKDVGKLFNGLQYLLKKYVVLKAAFHLKIGCQGVCFSSGGDAGRQSKDSKIDRKM